VHGGLRRRPEQRRLHRALVTMDSTTQVTCVCCPRGCTVTVDQSGRVTGNGCRNGAAYAQQQPQWPQRRVTGEIRVRGGAANRCAVKTDRPVPEELLDVIQDTLRTLEVEAPIYVSQVLVGDLCGSGANLVACGNVSRKTE
jgi:CxxC motif-containing protein